jgi:8-oxo-dGTP pyrophosphatase MutT (NUDIX family)
MSDDQPSPEPIFQACVVPFRRPAERIEVCLITSLKKGRWIFPKGIIDPGETLEQAALKEALEEAGLHGRIVGELLGDYEDFKWGTTLHVTVLLMEVTCADDEWPEVDVRERCWVDAAEAAGLLAKAELRPFVAEAIDRITGY